MSKTADTLPTHITINTIKSPAFPPQDQDPSYPTNRHHITVPHTTKSASQEQLTLTHLLTLMEEESLYLF